jgi:hypothetical protein
MVLGRERRAQELRRRCLTRAREGRAALVGARRVDARPRDFARRILDEELDEDRLPPDVYVDIMASIEASLLREYEEDLAALGEAELHEYEDYEDERLRDLLSASEAYRDDDVLCPVCRAGSVRESAGWLVCELSTGDSRGYDSRGRCNFCVNTCHLDAPLQLLRRQMCALLTEHATTCVGQGACSITTVGPGRLIFECPVCQGSCIVL